MTYISNIIATTDLGSPILLEVLSLELGMEQIECEPEQSSELIYRNSVYVILIFSSGKLLCTGFTDFDTMSEDVDDLASRI